MSTKVRSYGLSPSFTCHGSAVEYCAMMPDGVGLYAGNPVTQMGYKIGAVNNVTSTSGWRRVRSVGRPLDEPQSGARGAGDHARRRALNDALNHRRASLRVALGPEFA
jgi:hypothetical protein